MAGKFKFNLEKVKKHREQMENQAQRDFQLANSAMNEQIEILKQMRIEQSEAQKSRLDKTSVPALTQVHDYLVGQAQRIENQEKKIQVMEKRVEELRETLRQKAIETKILKELEHRKFRDFIEEVRKREARQVDDLNVMRFNRKRP